MNYAKVAAAAEAKIKKAGAEITITRKGDATGWTRKYNALTAKYYWENEAGTVVYADPAVSHEYTTWTLVKPASAGAIQAFDIRNKSGTLDESQLRALSPMAAASLEITPMPGDVVTLAGEKWTLLGNTPLVPDGETVIFHQCTAKKGA